MNARIVVVEGYDGSGKTSLIRTVFGHSPGNKVRVVGRKTEPELRGISRLIEDESGRLEHDTEVMLRFALETDRQHIVRAALATNDLVVLDRGLPSLVSWLDYYDLTATPYEGLVRVLNRDYEGSLMVICDADFETCWSRVVTKPSQSKKERLGREVNQTLYERYRTSLDRLAASHGDVLRLDTAKRTLEETAAGLREELARRWGK